jgi:hypothetical protein
MKTSELRQIIREELNKIKNMKPADNFDLKKFITEGKLVKEQLEKKSEEIISTKSKPYWADNSIMITDVVTQTNYTKDGYDIEVLNHEFNFPNKPPVSFKQTIKIFKDGNQIARKIFYSDADLWRGKSVEELIDFLIKKKLKNNLREGNEDIVSFLSSRKDELLQALAQEFKWDEDNIEDYQDTDIEKAGKGIAGLGEGGLDFSFDSSKVEDEYGDAHTFTIEVGGKTIYGISYNY